MTSSYAPPEPSGGFLDQKPRSPTSLAIVLLMHGAAIGALLLAKGPAIIEKIKPTIVIDIPIERPPEPNPEPRAEPEPKTPTFVERVPPIVEPPIRRSDDFHVDPLPQRPIVIAPPGPIEQIPEPRIVPTPTPTPMPVRAEAEVDPRYAGQLQPPYPASEQRAGNEGTVAIRVTIGTDGRVKDAQKVRATSEAFWRTTERHARSSWRFKPATLDGRPVESHKVMTVHFEIKD